MRPDLLLVVFDPDNGLGRESGVEVEQRVHGKDTDLVAKDGPAEVQERVERAEAGQADDDVKRSNQRHDAHPGPEHGAQVLVSIEVFQTSDGLSHGHVTRPRVQHVHYDHELGETYLDDARDEV